MSKKRDYYNVGQCYFAHKILNKSITSQNFFLVLLFHECLKKCVYISIICITLDNLKIRRQIIINKNITKKFYLFKNKYEQNQSMLRQLPPQLLLQKFNNQIIAHYICSFENTTHSKSFYNLSSLNHMVKIIHIIMYHDS